MLARYVQLLEYDPARPYLAIEIHDQMAPIAEAGALSSLVEDLKQFFGEGLQVSVAYGEAANSLAMQAEDKRVRDMQQTMQALADDPFISDMSRTFGSKVYVDSIASITSAP